MRIIAGKLGGRIFNDPAGHKVHPMSEKMRGALFNSLGDVSGLEILDAYSGSGALGFEAISRGCKYVTAVEVDKTAHKTILLSAQNLGIESYIKVIRANISSWSDNNPTKTYDIVLADPPYDKLSISHLQKLVQHVKKGGVLVLSWPGKLTAPELEGISKDKTQNHGDAQLTYYHYRDTIL